MLVDEHHMVPEEGHRVFVAAGDDEDCLVRVKHREPGRESPGDFTDTTLPTFAENVEAVLPEAFDGCSLVGERVKWEDTSGRMLEFAKITQKPSHRLLATLNNLGLLRGNFSHGLAFWPIVRSWHSNGYYICIYLAQYFVWDLGLQNHMILGLYNNFSIV